MEAVQGSSSLVALQLGSFYWSCSFACIAVLASLYKKMDILTYSIPVVALAQAGRVFASPR